jgi:hypothetical protein
LGLGVFQKYDGENDTGYGYYHRVDTMSGGDQNPTNTTGFTTTSEGAAAAAAKAKDFWY